MEEKTFWRVLLCVTCICAALTIAHVLYVVNAYQRSSIIYFIAKELW